MGLHTPGTQERILLMGAAGSGKSRGWLSIADLSQKTGSDAHFYCIDTDDAISHMLMVGFPHLENVTVVSVYEWDEYLAAVHSLRTKVKKKHDWLICDLYSNAWETVQEDYTNKVFGKTKAEYFLMRKREAAKKADEGYEGSSDWGVIKPMYRDFALPFFHRHEGHVLATCAVKPLQRTGKWKDSDEMIDWFGHLGFRPEGEKRTPHHVHAALYMRRKANGWVFTTGKDRERRMVVDEWLGDEETPGSLAKKYLIGVAGWRP